MLGMSFPRLQFRLAFGGFVPSVTHLISLSVISSGASLIYMTKRYFQQMICQNNENRDVSVQKELNRDNSPLIRSKIVQTVPSDFEPGDFFEVFT